MEQTSEELPIWRPAEPDPSYEPPSPVREDRGIFKRIGAGIAALGALIAKLGAQLKVLLLLLPKAKLFTTAGTMLVSVGAYALLWGWQFGLGFVLLLLVHETGHAIQLRREGMKATMPVFIPFLGAYIGMKEMPKNAAVEARVGLAGPVLGSIGCLVPLALYAATGNNLFRALAFIGFFLNLFNLLPIVPLDGGRAMAAISPVVWLIGFAGLVAAAIFFPNPIILLIVLFAGLEGWRRWKARKSPEMQDYHRVSRGTRIGVAAVYLGLALLLVVGMHYTHLPRSIN
jgi:Zn-dependent protease